MGMEYGGYSSTIINMRYRRNLGMKNVLSSKTICIQDPNADATTHRLLGVNREEQLQRNIGKDAISIAGTSLSSKCVVALEKQVTRELRAAYEYFSKYAWFSRSDVGLPGFASYFYH